MQTSLLFPCRLQKRTADIQRKTKELSLLNEDAVSLCVGVWV